jgi:D-alanine-D-alanine ligase
MAKIKVGVIFGGRSGEHEVSLVSASSVIKEISKGKYDVKEIGISKDGKWYASSYSGNRVDNVGLIEKFKSGEVAGLKSVSFEEALSGCDIVFPVLHGPFGEDGTIQGLFEMMHIPYVGAGVLSSSVCMDKITAKTILQANGVPVVPYLFFTRDEFKVNEKMILNEIEKEIGFPCFVKPSNLGSSVGISKVVAMDGRPDSNAGKSSKLSLRDAILFAAKFDSRILIEKGINAREIECAVMGNDKPEAATLGEILVGGEFYDYYDKYVDGKSSTQVPIPDLDENKQNEIKECCLKAYKLLDCSGISRVDCFLDKDSREIYLNEINTMPGFTSISMYPKMWQASGVSYPELIDKLIQFGFEKFKEKEKNQVSFDSGSNWFANS